MKKVLKTNSFMYRFKQRKLHSHQSYAKNQIENEFDLFDSDKFMECVLKELTFEEPKILDFLEKLENETIESQNEVREHNLRENIKSLSKIRDYEKQIIELKNALEELDLKVTEETNEKIDTFDINDKKARRKSETYKRYISFNNLEVSMKDLDNPNESKFDKNYKYRKEEYRKSLIRIGKLNIKKNELQIKLENSILKKNEIKEAIKCINEQLEKEKLKEAYYKKSETELEKFDNLTDKQRINLMKYFEIDKKMSVEASKMKENMKLVDNPIKYGKQVINLSIENLLKRGIITELELERVYSLLDNINAKVIERSYNHRMFDETKVEKIKKYKKVFSSFIENNYMESEHYKKMYNPKQLILQ